MLKDLEIFEQDLFLELQELGYDGDDYVSIED